MKRLYWLTRTPWEHDGFWPSEFFAAASDAPIDVMCCAACAVFILLVTM